MKKTTNETEARYTNYALYQSDILVPLIKWKILSLRQLMEASGFRGTYKYFSKTLIKLENEGVIGSYRNSTTGHKHVYLTEAGWKFFGEPPLRWKALTHLFSQGEDSNLAYKLEQETPLELLEFNQAWWDRKDKDEFKPDITFEFNEIVFALVKNHYYHKKDFEDFYPSLVQDEDIHAIICTFRSKVSCDEFLKQIAENKLQENYKITITMNNNDIWKKDFNIKDSEFHIGTDTVSFDRFLERINNWRLNKNMSQQKNTPQSKPKVSLLDRLQLTKSSSPQTREYH